MTVLRNTAYGLLIVVGLSACAGPSGDGAARSVSASPGTVVAVEKVNAIDRTQSAAAVRIGSAVIRAVVPGPWGGVASTTSNEVGRAAVSGTGGYVRYVVRMADGSLIELDQAGGTGLRAGDPVEVILMSDGRRRVVPGQLGKARAKG